MNICVEIDMNVGGKTARRKKKPQYRRALR